MSNRMECTCESVGCRVKEAYRHSSDDPQINPRFCRAFNIDGFGCTQPKGHRGRHVACTDSENKLGNEIVHVTWEEEDDKDN